MMQQNTGILYVATNVNFYCALGICGEIGLLLE